MPVEVDGTQCSCDTAVSISERVNANVSVVRIGGLNYRMRLLEAVGSEFFD